MIPYYQRQRMFSTSYILKLCRDCLNGTRWNLASRGTIQNENVLVATRNMYGVTVVSTFIANT